MQGRAVVAGAASAFVMFTASACVAPFTDDPDASPPVGDEELAELRRELPGDAFFVGRSFAGRPLTEILSGDEAGPASVVFLYGDCERPNWPEGMDPGGCPAPLEIQNASCSDGRTLVAIFANSKQMERRAADALRPVGGRAGRRPTISLGRSESC